MCVCICLVYSWRPGCKQEYQPAEFWCYPDVHHGCTIVRPPGNLLYTIIICWLCGAHVMSCAGHMMVVWRLCDVMCWSHDGCVVLMWCHVLVTWWLCGAHVMVMWLSCNHHVTQVSLFIVAIRVTLRLNCDSKWWFFEYNFRCLVIWQSQTVLLCSCQVVLPCRMILT